MRAFNAEDLKMNLILESLLDLVENDQSEEAVI